MPVTAMSATRRDDDLIADAVAEEPISELLEQAGRAVGVLAFREAHLAAVRHAPQLRRAALDVGLALGFALAVLSAFVLANSAAVRVMSGAVPAWAAALLLAAAWSVVALSLLLVLLSRGESLFDWWQPRSLGAVEDQAISGDGQARDDARQVLRESVERLTAVLENEAAVLAVVPAGRGAVSAAEHIIDQIDEFTDDLPGTVPGGGVINRVADTALLPAHYFVNVARAALEELSEPHTARRSGR
jgi:hypothetical protein